MAVNRNITRDGRPVERRSEKFEAIVTVLAFIAVTVIYGLIEHLG